MKRIYMVLAVALIATVVSHSFAATSQTSPLISGYGKAVPVENAGEQPDPAIDYKVVVNATKAGEDGAPPPALDKAARLANLLAASGVPTSHRHLVVVLSGPATLAVLTDAGEKSRGKAANASAELIAKLVAAGVQVHVCGQALAGAKISQSEVLPGIQVDLSALTTLTTLQLRGYALLPD
jgi:intracellular sulfur oxidation DsrE/DsrF family protein